MLGIIDANAFAIRHLPCDRSDALVLHSMWSPACAPAASVRRGSRKPSDSCSTIVACPDRVASAESRSGIFPSHLLNLGGHTGLKRRSWPQCRYAFAPLRSNILAALIQLSPAICHGVRSLMGRTSRLNDIIIFFRSRRHQLEESNR